MNGNNPPQKTESETNGISRRSFLGGLGTSSGYLFLGKTSNPVAGETTETVKVFAGSRDACPEPQESGRLYFAIDTGERLYDTGDDWQILDIIAPTGEFEDLSAETASIGIYESEFKPLRRPFDSRSRWQFGGWMKDNFDNLSEWTAVSGSVTADSDIVYMGDQSAKLSADGQPARIERSIEPTDFSNYDVSIAAKLNTSQSNIEVILRDGNDDYALFRGPLQANDDWIQSNMGVTEDTANFDITNVQKIQVQFSSDSGEVKGWVDNLRYHPKPDTAQCVLTFDDGTVSHYKKAYPIMQEFGFSGFSSLPTYYFETDSNLDMMSCVDAENQDPMTIDQMREMQKSGWEFGSEMQTHPSTAELPEQEVRDEVEGSKRWLLENGFARHVPALTYPYGSHDETVLDITSEYYAMARIVAGNLNRTTLTNPTHISGHSVYSDNISFTKELIDLAVKYNQTAVLNFHGLDEYAWQPGGEMSSDDFHEVLQYLYEKGPGDIQVVSYSNWWHNLDYFHNW